MTFGINSNLTFLFPGYSENIGLSSQVSSLSFASDGIPIADGEEEEDGQLQYEWSTEGEREIPGEEGREEDGGEEEVVIEQAVKSEESEEEFSELSDRVREPSGEPGQDSEPGYDLVTISFVKCILK